MAYKKESGIYKIVCLINKKVYIGQTKGLSARLYHQKYYLNKNCSHHPRLQLDWNKYGEKNFKFEILEKTNNLDERERFWINYYDSFNNGYNTTTGGIFNNRQDIFQKIKRNNKLKGDNFNLKGEKNPNCKISEKNVIEIKKMLKNKIDDLYIIKYFNLTKSQFQKIKHNRTWKHIII